MKRKGTNTTFVIICTAVLVVCYGIGLCIREIRANNAKEDAEALQKLRNAQQKTTTASTTNTSGTEIRSSRRDRTGTTEDGIITRSRGGRTRDMSEGTDTSGMDFGGGRMGGGFQDMSEEERMQMMENIQNMMGGFGGRGGRGGRSGFGGRGGFGGQGGFDNQGGFEQPGEFDNQGEFDGTEDSGYQNEFDNQEELEVQGGF